MKARLIMLTILFVALMAVAPAYAQDYSFEIPEVVFGVYVNPDASVKLEYTIQFHCNEGAHRIDIVDIGLPHSGYDISNMSASLDGQPMGSIRPSEYIDVGVEIPLYPPIEPGETKTFEFTCTMPDLVYQDTTNADYASLQITPTWFDGDLVTGTTKLATIAYLPDSLNLDDVLHQGEEFSAKMDLDDSQAVAWYYEATRMDGPHNVGVSFPKDVMDRVVAMTRLGLLWKWWTESTGARTIAGVVFLILFGIFFYRISAGTGTCMFIPAVLFLIILWAFSPTMEALFLPIFAPIWWLSERQLKLRHGKYLPPIASVPGAGIKRGLAVPEAAVLLELPLGKVLSLVIFGLLKKNICEIKEEKPLTVTLVEGYEVEGRQDRRDLARARGTVIRGFEQDFIETLIENPDTPVADLDFSDDMKNLIDTTVKRLKGFDVDQTREYYRSIISEAWSEAQEIGEIEKRDEYVQDNDLWLIMHPQSDHYFGTWHSRGYTYRPTWSTPGGGASTPVGGRTSLGDVAASFVGWSENVTGQLASSMNPVSISGGRSGHINLAGVDKVGVEMLESMAESSGSGGGGGGGCACACAGCACACACAGGGR